MKIEKDQKKFFDLHAASRQKKGLLSSLLITSFFYRLAVVEIREGFRWLSDRSSILDYGCGTGETIDLFLTITNSQPERIVGIDLSDACIEIAKSLYPYEFYVVPDNSLSFLSPASLSGAFMVGILHHTESHQKILDEIYRVLEPGGKFLIVDMTKNNPLIEFARAFFPYAPKRIQQMFPDDLVIDRTIPEKLRVDVDETIAALKKAGFTVELVTYGHLFFFIFDWFERMTHLNISKTKFNVIYSWIHRFEKRLLTMRFFKNRAHLFAIQAVKTH